MTPIQSDLYEYRFDPGEIRKIRGKLGLSQAKFAALLDVPPNTLSRWESAATAPDARSLAAIYSLAKEKGITPHFFIKQPSFRKVDDARSELLLVWDFQSLPVDSQNISFEWRYLERYLELVFPGSRTRRTCWAYTFPHQGEAADVLRQYGFEVFEGSFDADRQIVNDTLVKCKDEPDKYVFVLVAKDGDYSGLLKSLGNRGVDTYYIGDEDRSQRLIDAVTEDRFIDFDLPYVIITCLDAIAGIAGKSITSALFARACRQALEKYEVYPENVGFSRKNPYGSLLRWLTTKGLVTVREAGGRSSKITITVQD